MVSRFYFFSHLLKHGLGCPFLEPFSLGYISDIRHFFIPERVAPRVLSTWITGSVGVQESLETRDPVKVILGDTARMFTKTKV